MIQVLLKENKPAEWVGTRYIYFWSRLQCLQRLQCFLCFNNFDFNFNNFHADSIKQLFMILQQ